MKTPKFWLKKNWISYLLWPFSLVYFLGFLLSNFLKKKYKSKKFVICIGNLISGGSGKTPTAILLGEILKENNIDFVFLTRGYKDTIPTQKTVFYALFFWCKIVIKNLMYVLIDAVFYNNFILKKILHKRQFFESKWYQSKNREVFKIDDKENDVLKTSDEPLLLKKVAPVFVSKNRVCGIKFIEKNSDCKVVILDDGMQNQSLKKDLIINVIDSKIKFGNGFLLPAGPLRERVKSGIKKSDLILVIGEIDEELKEILKEKLDEKKVLQAKIIAKNIEEFYGEKLLAFSGLAYPEKFFSFVKECGLNLEDKVGFSDHYFYQDSDLEKLIKRAEENSQKLITTKKDWVKFSPKYRQEIGFLDIELKLDEEAKETLLKKVNL